MSELKPEDYKTALENMPVYVFINTRKSIEWLNDNYDIIRSALTSAAQPRPDNYFCAKCLKPREYEPDKLFTVCPNCYPNSYPVSQPSPNCAEADDLRADKLLMDLEDLNDGMFSMNYQEAVALIKKRDAARSHLAAQFDGCNHPIMWRCEHCEPPNEEPKILYGDSHGIYGYTKEDAMVDAVRKAEKKIKENPSLICPSCNQKTNWVFGNAASDDPAVCRDCAEKRPSCDCDRCVKPPADASELLKFLKNQQLKRLQQ
jgi:hypothetical protein